MMANGTVKRIQVCAFVVFIALGARGVGLDFYDFNSQALLNNFSGDSGSFHGSKSSISTTFDTSVCYGTNGTSLRVDYSVPLGFCGVWSSLLGKESFQDQTLNFTNLYESLRNSAGNPSRIENIEITNFSFYARGDGHGDFEHKIKIEFKNLTGVVADAVFAIPNQTNWVRYNFPIHPHGTNDWSRMKEVVMVIEDWRNEKRRGRFYLDDLVLDTDETPCPVPASDDAMLDLVSQRAFSYFLSFTDKLGFALDRSTYSDVVSVGAIGFQLTAYCIGSQRGWADKAELENRVTTILQNLKDLPMGPETGTVRSGYRGFYYHFLGSNTGRRKDAHVELSLYDTTLLMYGVLTCKEYFQDNSRIQTLSQELFDRVEWDWLVDHVAGPNQNQFCLAWMPGHRQRGTFLGHVDGQTDEAFMVDLLALGSKTHPVSIKSYFARNRPFSRYPASSTNRIMVSWGGSLFNYFFASCWVNFEARGFDLHPAHPENIWKNDRLAILANYQFCVNHARRQAGGNDDNYATYGTNAWGLTACDNLSAPEDGVAGPTEYIPFGALPTEQNIRFGTRALQAGTLAVYGAAGAINFMPAESIAALRHYFEIPSLWNPLFGFGDAFSLDPHYITDPYDDRGNPTIRFASYLNGPWINKMTMGINVGPMLLSIENYRSHQIWKLMAGNPVITTGLNSIFGIGAPEARTLNSSNGNGGTGNFTLQWESEPGASNYSIFASTNSQDWRLLQSGLRDTAWNDARIGDKSRWLFRVKALE